MAKLTKKQLDALGHSLAYENSVSSIECSTVKVWAGPESWMALDSDPDNPLAGSDTAALVQELEYLDARGLLVRHAEVARWIQIRDESEATR